MAVSDSSLDHAKNNASMDNSNDYIKQGSKGKKGKKGKRVNKEIKLTPISELKGIQPEIKNFRHKDIGKAHKEFLVKRVQDFPGLVDVGCPVP